MKGYTIVIQIDLKSWQESEGDELHFRHNLEIELDELFKKVKNGWCDGGQMGGGTMEVFMYEILDLDFGLDMTLAYLKAKNMKADYKVAWHLSDDDTTGFKIAFSTKPEGLLRFDWFHF